MMTLSQARLRNSDYVSMRPGVLQTTEEFACSPASALIHDLLWNWINEPFRDWKYDAKSYVE
jgi:hypothetical protein